MSKHQTNIAKPVEDIRMRVAGWTAAACMVVFTLWQGSYFPLQFMLMLILLAASLAVFGKKIIVSRETALLLAIPLLYAISLALKSDNHYAGLIETLRTLILPMSLILFRNSDAARMKKALTAALMCVAILGLLAYASVIKIPGGVIEGSNRLQSVIQYANTTALLMLIGVLYTINGYITEKKLTHLFSCAIFAAALLLTGSRTTLAVAAVVCFSYVFIITGRKGRLITAGVLAIAGGLFVCLNLFTEIRVFQISIYEPTLVERWITYQDAVKMMRGNWLFGIGAGNWQERQFLFQSAPYQVKYIHNYYLQLLLDGGFLAPIAFCSALIPSIYKGIRSKNIHAIILIAVMLHALLDFDLIFSALAVIAMFSLSQLPSSAKTFNLGRFRLIAIIPLAAVLVLWMSELLSTVADAHLERGEPEVSMGEYRAALALNPLNTDIYYQMAQSTRDLEVTTEFISTAIAKKPRDTRAISIMALIESRNGNYGAALDLCSKLVEYRRYSDDIQALYRDIAKEALEHGAIGDIEYKDILGKIDMISQDVNPLYTKYIRPP